MTNGKSYSSLEDYLPPDHLIMLDVDPETVTNSSHGGGSELAVNQYRLIESSIGQPSSLLTSLRHEGSTAYEGRLSTVSDRLSVRHIAAVSKIPACTVTGVVTILSHRCYVNAYGDMVGTSRDSQNQTR